MKKSSTRRRKPTKKNPKAAAGGAGENTSDGAAGNVAPTLEGRADEVKKKKSSSPLEFAQEVRSELSKVSWTSRNETLISTMMVLIMVAIMAAFFFLVDQTLRFGVCNILPIECVTRDSI